MQTTPLQKAIANNFVEMVGILIRFGADVDLPSFSGWRPLHFAISAVFSSGASPNIIKILIFNGADNNASNEFVQSPFVWAIERNLPDQLIEMFLVFSRLTDDTKQDGLRAAIHRCNESHIQLLVEYGVNLSDLKEVQGMPRFASDVSDDEINSTEKLVADLKIFIPGSDYDWKNVDLQNLYSNKYDSEYVRGLIDHVESNADNETLVIEAVKTISAVNKLYFRILNDKKLFVCMDQYGKNILSKVESSGFFSLKPQSRIDKLKKHVAAEAIEDNRDNIGEEILDEAIWGLALEQVGFQITETDLLGISDFHYEVS